MRSRVKSREIHYVFKVYGIETSTEPQTKTVVSYRSSIMHYTGIVSTHNINIENT